MKKGVGMCIFLIPSKKRKRTRLAGFLRKEKGEATAEACFRSEGRWAKKEGGRNRGLAALRPLRAGKKKKDGREASSVSRKKDERLSRYEEGEGKKKNVFDRSQKKESWIAVGAGKGYADYDGEGKSGRIGKKKKVTGAPARPPCRGEEGKKRGVQLDAVLRGGRKGKKRVKA